MILFVVLNTVECNPLDTSRHRVIAASSSMTNKLDFAKRHQPSYQILTAFSIGEKSESVMLTVVTSLLSSRDWKETSSTVRR